MLWYLTILSSLIATVVVVVAILANITQIAQFFGVDFHRLRRGRSAEAIIEGIIQSFQRMPLGPIEEALRSWEEDAKNAGTIINRQIAYLFSGFLYEASGDFRKALQYYTIAMELNYRVSDPYYAIGNFYYDISLLDLIIKRRFSINEDQLICTLKPDNETKKLFEKVTQEYELGSRYPFIHDITKFNVGLTSPHILDHRKRQIAGVLKGNSVITLHRLEMMKLGVWVTGVFPKDEELVSKTVAFAEKLINYAKENPDEFVGLLPLKEIMK